MICRGIYFSLASAWCSDAAERSGCRSVPFRNGCLALLAWFTRIQYNTKTQSYTKHWYNLNLGKVATSLVKREAVEFVELSELSEIEPPPEKEDGDRCAKGRAHLELEQAHLDAATAQVAYVTN